MKIILQNVSFSFSGDKPAIKNISTSFATGQLTSILGSNGSGKTTLLRLLAGELHSTDGKIHTQTPNTQNIAYNPSQSIAYIPQDVQDPAYLTVRETVAMARFNPRKFLGWKLSPDDKRIVEESMTTCGVIDFSERTFSRLSGGEKQRAWLAFCLAQQRNFMLLDESLSGIDFVAKDELFTLMAKIAENGKGILLVTHDPDMAQRHSHHVLILKNQEIIYDGLPPQNLHSMI